MAREGDTPKTSQESEVETVGLGQSTDGSYRYEQVPIHLCQGCGSSFYPGDEVVTLSDGFIETDESHSPDNIRFFHGDCWKNSRYMDTGSDCDRGVRQMGSLGAAEDTDRDDWNDLELSYHSVRPNKWTFQSKKIRRWVESRLEGRVLNACAGKTKLTSDHEIVRNDLDENRDADLHVDVCELADHLESDSFNTIVYDPPFSQNQATQTYDIEDGEAVVAGSDAIAKRQFDKLLAPGGLVVQFGYTTTCMPTSLGYERLEVGVWNTLGRSNDYLSVVDKKPGETEVQSRWFSTETSDTTGTEGSD